jgi:hypothetical protein
MPSSFFANATALQLVIPILIGLAMAGLVSLLPEPVRHKFSAVLLAGAGAAYLSGGFGLLEFAFCAVMTVLAYFGLDHYRAIAIGWIAHTIWDYFHHLYGKPIIPFAPASSFGCAICDAVIALWYAAGAPSIPTVFTQSARRPDAANL